ncbi:hypothetical protein HY213_04285 [Candidatus Peregrinibacteria bacterium]|nr:hypothetical protein [Candidatus Peregrinibacteria bacterium]
MKQPEKSTQARNDQYMKRFMRYVDAIGESAANVGDEFVMEEVVIRLHCVAIQIATILRRFKENPGASVQQIAAQMKLSRNALYVVFARCGIDDPKDLEEPSAHLADFFRKNRVHEALADLIMQTEGEYLLLREKLDSMDPKSIFIDWKEAYGCKKKNEENAET